MSSSLSGVSIKNNKSTNGGPHLAVCLSILTTARPGAERLLQPMVPAKNLVNADAIARNLAAQAERRQALMASTPPFCKILEIAFAASWCGGPELLFSDTADATVESLSRQVYNTLAEEGGAVTIYHNGLASPWITVMSHLRTLHPAGTPVQPLPHLLWSHPNLDVRDINSVLVPRADLREDLSPSWLAECLGINGPAPSARGEAEFLAQAARLLNLL